MKTVLLTLILLFSFELYSQEIIEFKKGEFEFYLSKDCQENECKIIDIKIFKNGDFLQEITPSKNRFSSFTSNESILKVEDMNFDNHLDFRIIKSIPAEYPFPYLYWIYNAEEKIFEKNLAYAIIISPKFDYDKKIIISSWDDYIQFYKDYYKLENEIPILIERNISTRTKKGITKIETWKAINGKLKLIN